MNANTLRRLNWLWKNRHTHEGDTTQDQITVIRERLEQVGDVAFHEHSGAHIHLTRDATQTIAVGGENISWTAYNPFIIRENFDDVSFPITEVTILIPGYYNALLLEDSQWDTYDDGGTLRIIHDRGGAETVVAEVTATNGQGFRGGAHAVPCIEGDKFKVFIDHNDSVTRDLGSAALAVYLVDGSSDAPAAAGVIDSITSHEVAQQTHDIAMTSAQTDGDMMLMVLVAGNTQWTTYPSGWTLLVDNYLWGAASGYLSVLYKVSDGTETATTAETSAQTNNSAHAVWVIRSGVDYSSNPPTAATPVKVQDIHTINPPAVTPAQGAGTYFVFPVVAHNGGSGIDVVTHPDGYATFLEIGAGTSVSASHWIGRKLVAIVTTEDPTSVTFETWPTSRLGSTTVAVRI